MPHFYVVNRESVLSAVRRVLPLTKKVKLVFRKDSMDVVGIPAREGNVVTQGFESSREELSLDSILGPGLVGADCSAMVGEKLDGMGEAETGLNAVFVATSLERQAADKVLVAFKGSIEPFYVRKLDPSDRIDIRVDANETIIDEAMKGGEP